MVYKNQVILINIIMCENKLKKFIYRSHKNFLNKLKIFMAKKKLYYLKQYPCNDEIAVVSTKNDTLISSRGKIKKELEKFNIYLSHNTKLVYKGLSYDQQIELKEKIGKFVYSENN